MKNRVYALLIGTAFGLASAGLSDAMSLLVSVSKEPVWPTSATPDGSLVYNVTTVGRAGAGLLEVTLAADGMPPGTIVTFSPSVLRFTGSKLTSQTATITVTCPGVMSIDCLPFTITGTSQREAVTVTNEVLFSADFLATRAPTLVLDRLTNGGLRLRGSGATGKTYQIEATSDLANPVWTPLGFSTADGNGRFTFFPAQAPNVSVRFFRAAQLTPYY